MINFLKKNPNSYFSATEISRFCGVNKQTGIALLNKLEKELNVKLIYTGKTAQATKVYAITNKNDYLDASYAELVNSATDPRFLGLSTELRALLLILAELKKIGGLKDG